MASMDVDTGPLALGGQTTSGGQSGEASELQINEDHVANSQSRLPIPHVFDKSHLAEV